MTGVATMGVTFGTTGKPKGVMLSHSTLVVQSLAKIAAISYSEDHVYLHTAPLGHVGGLSSALTMLMVGSCRVLMPKFEANSALEAIEKYNVTSFITVPVIMSDIFSLVRKEVLKMKVMQFEWSKISRSSLCYTLYQLLSGSCLLIAWNAKVKSVTDYALTLVMGKSLVKIDFGAKMIASLAKCFEVFT